MKSPAVKAGKIKPTPRIFQAPEKLNVLEVCVNPLMHLQTALKLCSWLLHCMHYDGPKTPILRIFEMNSMDITTIIMVNKDLHYFSSLFTCVF